MKKYHIERIDILPSHNVKVTRLTEPSESRHGLYGKYLEYRIELPDEEKCNEF